MNFSNAIGLKEVQHGTIPCLLIIEPGIKYRTFPLNVIVRLMTASTGQIATLPIYKHAHQ